MTPYIAFTALVLAVIVTIGGLLLAAVDWRIRRRRHAVSTAAIDAFRAATRAAGRVAATEVESARARAAWDDTRQLPTVHQPRHAAPPDRDDLVGQLEAAGWTRDELRANAAAHHQVPAPRNGR